MSQRADQFFESLESRTLLAVFTVDTLADVVDGDYGAGKLSLREAIQLANATESRDEIHFAESIHGGTITLLLGKLEITEDLDIIGPGPDKMTINAGGLSRIFSVDIGTSEDIRDVRFEGMTLTGGRDEFGGAIHSKENLEIRDAVITGNEATSGQGGGGIDVRDATLTIANSVISANSAPMGQGAGVQAGAVSVVNSTFTGNAAKGAGGAIHSSGGDGFSSGGHGPVVIIDSEFSGNSAGMGSALAVSLTTGPMSITGSSFTDNKSRGGSLGAAVAVLVVNTHTTLTIADSEFLRNENGALATDGFGWTGGIVIHNCVFKDNTSPNMHYGAIALGGPHAEITDCVFDGNSAMAGGTGRGAGAIAAATNGLTISNSVVSNNTTTGSFASAAVVIHDTFSGPASIIDSQLTGNTGETAGAIFFSAQWASEASLLIDGSTISGNTSASGTHGAVYVQPHNDIQPYQVTVRDSFVSDNTGGGLNLWGHTLIERSRISGNVGTGWGGGMYHYGNVGSLEIVDSRFDSNEGESGGGLAALSLSTIIRNSLFVSNIATGQGGGLFISPTHNGTAIITNTTITGNRAGTNGGGLQVARTTIANSTIVHNVADTSDHGGFRGGGLYSATYSGQENEVRIYSSIVAHNTRTNAAIDDQIGGSEPTDSSHNLIGGDPMLAPLADYGGPTHTYALLAGSPAIDAGANPQNLGTDARGKARVFGSAADAGAFEFNGPPSIATLVPSKELLSQSEQFTLTATITDPGDAPIVAVRFYHDANRDGIPDDGELIATDSDAAEGWSATVGPFPSAGSLESFIAVAVNALGYESEPFAADAAFDANNTRPSVDSLVVSSGVVERGRAFTITAGATDPDGAVAQVRFTALFDLNGDGLINDDDTIIDADGSNGFSAVISAAASRRIPADGVARFRVVAVDALGAESEPATFAFDSLLSRFVADGFRMNASSDAGNVHRIVGVNLDGRLVVFEPFESGWIVRDAAPGLQAGFVGPSTTWTDPKDGLSYAAAVTPDGLMLLQRSGDGQWTVRNLSDELAGSLTPLTALTHFVSTDGLVVMAGITADGRIVAFRQTGSASGAGFEWTFINISDDHLAPQGMSTPALSELIAYVPAWNAWHLAGIDADGNIQSIWIMPGAFDLWRVDNLSEITGAPLIAGQLAVTLTSWQGINLAGLDAEGRLMVTWWVPEFSGDWLTNDLTDSAAGPILVAGQISGYTTPWGGLNYAGIDTNGDLTVYWWTPTLDAWVASPLIEGEVHARPVGRLTTHASQAGTLNISGVGQANDVIRVHWQPGMDGWLAENLSEIAAHA